MKSIGLSFNFCSNSLNHFAQNVVCYVGKELNRKIFGRLLHLSKGYFKSTD